MHHPKHIYLSGIITGILSGLLASLVWYETATYVARKVHEESSVSTWSLITPLYMLGGGVIGLIISAAIHHLTKQK